MPQFFWRKTVRVLSEFYCYSMKNNFRSFAAALHRKLPWLHEL